MVNEFADLHAPGLNDSIYFVSQKTVVPQVGINREFNQSLISDDLMQRLPDQNDHSKYQCVSDEEERLNIFGACDLNINDLFESTKSSLNQKAMQENRKASLSTQHNMHRFSQVQNMNVGDGNTLHNHF